MLLPRILPVRGSLAKLAAMGMHLVVAARRVERLEQLAALTRVYALQMVARGRGYLLQVASVAAYKGVPGYALYAAAKAFVRNYGEAVRCELRGTGVSVTVLSPGVTATEFQEVAGEGQSLFPRVTMISGDRVGLSAILPRKLTIRVAQLFAR